MSMSYKIGIRLRLFFWDTCGINGKSANLPVPGPEPYGKVGFESASRILLAACQNTHVYQPIQMIPQFRDRYQGIYMLSE
jgi:hypothetical protein